MTQVKSYLNQYGEIYAQVMELEEDLAFLKSVTEYKSVDLTKTGETRGIFDRIGINASKIMDIEAELNAKIKMLSVIRGDIEHKLKRLPNPKQRNIMIGRYLDRKAWSRIAEENGIGERWMFKLHKNGLERLKDMTYERFSG